MISNHVTTPNTCSWQLMLKPLQVLLCETTVDLSSIDQNNPIGNQELCRRGLALLQPCLSYFPNKDAWWSREV